MKTHINWSVKGLQQVGAFLAVLLVLSGCGTAPKTFDELVKGELALTLNPYERSPLGALASFTTTEPVAVSLEIAGDIAISKTFDTYNTIHSVPILGLYPNKLNSVKLTLTTEGGTSVSKDLSIQTAPLPDFLPSIDVTKLEKNKMEEGLHLIEMLVANNGKFHSYTMMFDDNGAVRWYMDMSSTGQITYSALRNKRGNWLYLDWDDIYELDDLGRQVSKKQMTSFAGNHHVMEADNGNLLMGGTRKGADVVRADGRRVVTRFDHVLEWDLAANQPVNYWDIGEYLDIDRIVFNPGYSLDFMADWFHLNGIAKDSKDGSIIASGRSQGVVKMGADKSLKWIMAPHARWGKAGRTGQGNPTEPFLLTALDREGKPLPENVQFGIESTDDFSWNTGQHSMNILPNGNLLIFDNGMSRDFAEKPTYSRAVEYKIDDEKRTIQQVWQYGKERGLEMFSPITSDVDVLANGNRLITSGNIRLSDKPAHAKLIEITYPKNEVVFEAEIYFKDAKGTGEQAWAQFDLVYRGQRYHLYDDGQGKEIATSSKSTISAQALHQY
ncbi:aryl-sulfate sulfotransferase [Roseivirga pacifica]|uniref:aryl-sulfate sulfotransferase n=1 Tax=Roseivirga pacifica TaxID=1267423 RepID=UPI003BAF3603